MKRASVVGMKVAVLGLTLALSTAVCDDDDDGSGVNVERDAGAGGGGGQVSGAGGADGGTVEAGPTAPVATEAQVLGVMVEANAGEVAVNTLARSRVRSAPLVQFADLMITEHSAAAARNAALATRLGLVPADSAVRAQLRMDAMATSSMLTAIQDVAAFEAAYIQSQVSMHTMVLALINQQLLPLAQTPDLRTELTMMRTAVMMHLAQTQTLQAGAADGGTTDGR